MDTEIREAAISLTRRVKQVYVTTLDSTGAPETRVLFNLLKVRSKALSSGPARLEPGFSNYLGTNTSSKKVGQIRHDNRVCLYYCDNRRFEGCMVKGRLEEVTDPDIRKAVWTPTWNMYYYGGLDGGDFSLLRFIPEHIRYYKNLAVHEADA